MTPPVASILIPCGPNHLELLDRAVASAEAQTVPVEVLTFVDHDRKGPGYGRNVLAKQARGLFVCMLDADDHLYPHAIETMLEHWQPGSYVYSDWHEYDDGGEPHHVEATSCYIDWRYNKPDQRAYHLTPVLFPTRIYYALGGMNEKLKSAEDTDFFFKANVAGVTSIHVREPLFIYTDDGGHARSTEGRQVANWTVDLAKLFMRYQREAKVACCGDMPARRDIMNAVHQEGDILVHANWKGNHRVVGRVTGRKYGRHGHGAALWMSPEDVQADARHFTIAKNDMEGLSPSQAQIEAAMSTAVSPTAKRVARAGIRNWATMEKPGLDIQQVPQEIAALLDFAQERDVQTVLEIGTGESGGLARFMAGELGWHVTSIDLNVPETFIPDADGVMGFESGGTWQVIEANSQTPDSIAFEDDGEGIEAFDLVFIDGDHTYEAAKADHENYANRAVKIVAFHDIAPDGWWEGSARYWSEIAHTKGGKPKKGYYEAIEPNAKTGLGWYVVSD